MNLIYSKILKVSLLFIFLHITIFAGETGKIAGHISDFETSEPLAFANVVIFSKWINGEEVKLDNPFGAASDINGDYYILNIAPGTYNVKVSYIGYSEVIRTKVKIYVDKTTRINFKLKSKTYSSEEVIVTAYSPDKAERDLTATKNSYSLSEIEALPGITNIGSILSLQADVSDGHFRGGRSGESQYLIGGSSIVNPLNNSKSFDPISLAFQQVEVYTSGFSAEYGNVQSGVINMVTREGNSHKWQTTVEVASTNSYYKTWGGSVYSTRNLIYYNLMKNPDEWIDGLDPASGKILWTHFGINFPENYLPIPPLTFPPTYLSREDSLRTASLVRSLWLQSARDVGLEYNKPDYRVDVALSGPLAKKFSIFVAGRFNSVNPILPSNEPDIQRQVLSSFTYKPNTNNKFKLLLNYNEQTRNEFNSDFFTYFERVFSLNINTNTSSQFGLEWNHVMSQSTFLDFKLGLLNTRDRDRINLLADNEYSTIYNDNSNWRFYTDPSGHTVGKLNTSIGDSKTYSFNFSGSITSQVDKYNLVKSGLQLFYYDLDVNKRLSASNKSSLRLENYHVYPYEGAVYLQDKMEFEGMIANIGLRYDFYNFNTKYYLDKFSPFRNPNFDPKDPSSPYFSSKLAATEDTKLVSVLQPRIGISFPVDERTVLHLNYGVFSQRPAFQYIYTRRFKLSPEPNFTRLGNPQLEPEKTISYDIGVVRTLPFGISIDLSAYLKDVSNLIELAIYADASGNQYETFINKEYADIKGFQINLEKNEGILRGFLRYNWQSSKGKSGSVFGVGARSVFFENDSQNNILPDAEDVFLDYDRTHRVLANLTLQFGENGLGLGDIKPFSNFSISGIYTFQTGRPFTYDVSGKGLRFNLRTPDEHDFKIRIEKKFSLGYVKFNLYVEGFNIFNNKVFDYDKTFSEDPTNRYRTQYIQDQENLFIEKRFAPYVTNIEGFLLGNQPRHFRFGVNLQF